MYSVVLVKLPTLLTLENWEIPTGHYFRGIFSNEILEYILKHTLMNTIQFY